MRVYLDHNATTPLREEARERWLEVSARIRGNPSSVHAAGRRARSIVDDSRARVAGALGVAEDEIVFTSGGTESNNLALFGVLAAAPAGHALVTSAIEHSSVLGPARELAARGRPLTLLSVDSQGRVDPGELSAALRRAPAALVSIQAANNEIGTLQPLAELARSLADLPPGTRPRFHTDAAQALGRVEVDLASRGVDLATFSAHKVGGPSGIGILWRAKGTPLHPRLFGGGQELELRPGTEDVPGIAAAACAIELAVQEQAEYARATGELVRFLWKELERELDGVRLLGPPLESHERLPNTLCVLVPGTDGKVLVTRLDLEGLETSAGSACASGSIEPSHVLVALGLDENAARSGLRLSLGRSTTHDECKRAVDILKKVFAPSRAT